MKGDALRFVMIQMWTHAATFHVKTMGPAVDCQLTSSDVAAQLTMPGASANFVRLLFMNTVFVDLKSIRYIQFNLSNVCFLPSILSVVSHLLYCLFLFVIRNCSRKW